MQSIRAFFQRLPFNGDRIAEGDRCVLIGTGMPYLAVRNHLAPDLPSIGERAMVVKGYVSDANSLHHLRMLARSRQIKHQGFSGSGLRLAKTGQQQDTGQYGKHTKTMHTWSFFAANGATGNSEVLEMEWDRARVERSCPRRTREFEVSNVSQFRRRAPRFTPMIRRSLYRGLGNAVLPMWPIPFLSAVRRTTFAWTAKNFPVFPELLSTP